MNQIFICFGKSVSTDFDAVFFVTTPFILIFAGMIAI